MTEYARGNVLTGFPWNLIIYSFSENIDFLSFLSVIGTYSFNLLVISFFTVPAVYVLRKSKKVFNRKTSVEKYAQGTQTNKTDSKKEIKKDDKAKKTENQNKKVETKKK